MYKTKVMDGMLIVDALAYDQGQEQAFRLKK